VIPSDATLLTDPDEVAAKVLPPRIEIEEVPVAEVEGEEVEEAAAEGPEGATPTAESSEAGAES
jgi:hypothetical protein